MPPKESTLDRVRRESADQIASARITREQTDAHIRSSDEAVSQSFRLLRKRFFQT